MISIKIWETPLSWLAKCSFPVAARVSKTRVLKLPNNREFTIYDAVVNENATKQQYHWLNEEK